MRPPPHLTAGGDEGRALLTRLPGVSCSIYQFLWLIILYRSRMKHECVGRIIEMTSREIILSGDMRCFIVRWPGGRSFSSRARGEVQTMLT
jgi:hypothetical protein